MKKLAIALLSISLYACSIAPVVPEPEKMLSDNLFSPPTVRISVDDVMALSDEMKQYVQTKIAEQVRIKGPKRGLFEALYDMRQLQLEYDPKVTRNAAEAFADRTGNCISLVLMTGALAKAIGLPVQYQTVLGEASFSRSGTLYFSNRHVNISLYEGGLQTEESTMMTIDFFPPEEIRQQRRRLMSETEIIAMYFNNRAAETLSAGQFDNAYWWVRAAIMQDPKFLDAYNTLGVIYRRHGNPNESRRVLENVLDQEPANTTAMSNLLVTLNDLGLTEEIKILSKKLQQQQTYPPFYLFDLGKDAMKKRDFKTAVGLFRQEIERDQYYHEFHFWLAAAYGAQGDLRQMKKQLLIAIENSPNRWLHDGYQAQLNKLDAANFTPETQIVLEYPTE